MTHPSFLQLIWVRLYLIIHIFKTDFIALVPKYKLYHILWLFKSFLDMDVCHHSNVWIQKRMMKSHSFLTVQYISLVFKIKFLCYIQISSSIVNWFSAISRRALSLDKDMWFLKFLTLCGRLKWCGPFIPPPAHYLEYVKWIITSSAV